jgi:Rad3-related DNA helicase
LNFIFGNDYPITCDATSYVSVLEFLNELDSMLIARSRELENDAKISDSKREYYSTVRKMELVVRLHETISYIRNHWSPTTLVIDMPEFYKNKQKFNTLRLRFVDVSEPFSNMLSEMITVNGAFCLMSATLQPEATIRSTFKIDVPMKYMKVRVDWPIKNRPVILMKGFALNRENLIDKKYDIFEIVRKVGDIVTAKGMNLLVHTHSNMIRDFLVDSFIGDPRIISHDLPDYNFPISSREAFDLFRQSTGRILISASMSEGLDFKDDICRVQIIAKIPYPNMADVWVRRKKDLDPDFLSTEALLSLEQMIGRIHRNRDDYGITFILDSSFLNLTRGKLVLDSQAWDNLIGYKKTERIDTDKLVEIARVFVEEGVDGISRPLVSKVSQKDAARIGKKMTSKFESFEF